MGGADRHATLNDELHEHRLRAGANLVTINLTPADVRGNYVIYKRDRFIMTEERILAALDAEGLQPSLVGLVEHLERRTAPSTAVAG